MRRSAFLAAFPFGLFVIATSFARAAAPAAPEPTVLTLERCVQIAIHNATSILQTGNQYGLSGAQVLQAYGQFLPNLNVGGSYGYVTGTTLYTFQGITLVTIQGQQASFTVSSTLNLFNGMADYANLKAAVSRRTALEASIEWAREQVALDITQSYLQLVLDEQILDIARRSLAASQARLQLLQGQERVGAASRPDLFRQQADTSSNRFNVTSAEARVRDEEILILRKLRIDPAGNYRFETPALDAQPSPLASRNVDQLIESAIDSRADVRANSSQLEASDWGVTGARSGYLPRIDLAFNRVGLGMLLSQEQVNGQNSLFLPQRGLGSQLGNQVEYTIGLNLTWNLFDRFATRLNVEQASTVREDTRIALDDSRFQVQADVRTAYVNYQSAWSQLDSARAGVEAARKAFDVTEGMYRVGSASIVDVLTAQAALTQAQANLAQVLTNLKLQEKSLEYAVGRIVE